MTVTVHERDLMGPHRGILVKMTELHGIMGVYEYKIERAPFWMEIRPENMAIMSARAQPKAWERG